MLRQMQETGSSTISGVLDWLHRSVIINVLRIIGCLTVSLPTGGYDEGYGPVPMPAANGCWGMI